MANKRNRKHHKPPSKSLIHDQRREWRKDNFFLCGLPLDLWEFAILPFLDLFSVLKMMKINKQFYNYIENLDDLEFWRDVRLKNLEAWAFSIQKDLSIFSSFMGTNEKILEEMKRLKFKQIVINLYKSFWMEFKDLKNIKTYLNSGFFREPTYQQPITELSFHMVQPNEQNHLGFVTNCYSDRSYSKSYCYNEEYRNIKVNNGITVPLLRTFHGKIQVFKGSFSFKTNIPTQTHTICGFNRFHRQSWEYLRDSLMAFVNQPYPIILVGIYWRDSLDITVDKTGYVNFTEIIKFCSENQISSYIDAKVGSETEVVELFNHVIRVSLLNFGFDSSLLGLNNMEHF